MRAQSWIERLEEAYDEVPAVRHVRGAISLAATAAAPKSLAAGTAFVAPAGDTGRNGEGGVAQLVDRRMLVVVALRDPSDALGADGMSDLERVVDVTVRALIGWRPPGAKGRVVYRDGSLFEFTDRTVWWQMNFAVPVLLTQGGHE